MNDSRIVALLTEVLQRLSRLEREQASIRPLIDRIAEDTDAIDRALRPYGDGTRPPRRRR